MGRTKEFTDKLHAKVRKAIKEYALLSDGDNILIGLSGGKDSLALTEFLSERLKIFKPRINLIAAHVRMSNIKYESDTQYLKEFTESRGIKFVERETCFDTTTDKRKSPCFLCSWNRRKVLFDTAKELGCNKIALGHHQDDIIYTMLMNLFFQGSFSTMPPLLCMDKFDMTIIRPMALLKEEEIRKMAELNHYQKQKKICPYEKESFRSQMQEIVKIAEQMNPNAKQSIWNAMNNVLPQYLPNKKRPH